MLRFIVRFAVGFSFFNLFVFSIFAQDSVKFVDKTKKGENELNGEEAKALIANGVKCVAEGANMPSTPEAIEAFQHANVLFSPGKASNAGGVATSGLEMSQNSLRLSWSAEEVDQRLHGIMVSIHEACVKYGKGADGYVDYVKGANIAGFVKVADSMIDQGLV